MKEIAIVLDTMIVGGVERALIELLKMFDCDQYHITLFLENGDGSLQHMIPENVDILLYGSKDAAQFLHDSMRSLNVKEICRGIINRVLARVNISQYDLNEYYCTKCLPVFSEKNMPA